jgi:hypothetical protein
MHPGQENDHYMFIYLNTSRNIGAANETVCLLLSKIPNLRLGPGIKLHLPFIFEIIPRLSFKSFSV